MKRDKKTGQYKGDNINYSIMNPMCFLDGESEKFKFMVQSWKAGDGAKLKFNAKAKITINKP